MKKILKLIFILTMILAFVITSSFTYAIYKNNRLNTFPGYKLISRDYNWYVNQMNTGENADQNCVPSCTAMVLKWANKEIDYLSNVNKLRDEIAPDYKGTGWQMQYMKSAMDKYGINNYTLSVISIDMMTSELDKGKILIVLLKYPESTHTIIIKGYEIKLDNTVYFHVYDPASGWPGKSLSGFYDTLVSADDIYTKMISFVDSSYSTMYVVTK